MSEQFSREEIEAAKKRLRRQDMYRELGEVLKRMSEVEAVARVEMDAEAEAAEAEPDASVTEPRYRGLTFSEIRDAYQASLADDNERGHRGSKPNVARRLNVHESTLVRAWSDHHGGNPPEWPTGLEPDPEN